MHEIRIPRLGWSMEQGTFVRWLKQHGEPVKKGDALFELEGDKNVQEIESVEAGTLNIPSNAPAPGTIVDVGTLLGWLLATGEAPPEVADTKIEPPHESPTKTAGPAARRMAAEMGIPLDQITGTGRSGLITKEDVSAAAAGLLTHPISTSTDSNATGKKTATPRARRVAREHGVDWSQLQGTGRDGRIREADILRALQAQPQNAISAPPALPASGQKLSPRRRAIADRLRRSQQLTIPVTLHSVADVTELVALRDRLKQATPAAAPSFTDLIAALLPWVYKRHPHMAVVWGAGHESLVPVAIDELNIGIAVDTPAGLLVPVVQNVAGKPLNAISAETRRLIELARSGQLRGDQMQGGTLTITNLGPFGIDGFTPVINLPEIAILGLGAIRREPVYLPDNSIAPRLRMTLSLTFDHAAVDGAPAAAFLKSIAEALNDPAAFLLNG